MTEAAGILRVSEGDVEESYGSAEHAKSLQQKDWQGCRFVRRKYEVFFPARSQRKECLSNPPSQPVFAIARFLLTRSIERDIVVLSLQFYQPKQAMLRYMPAPVIRYLAAPVGVIEKQNSDGLVSAGTFGLVIGFPQARHSSPRQ